MLHVDASVCKPCGICGKACPRHITEVIKEGDERRLVVVEERLHLCMDCGHCAAVCPTGAITVDGLDPAGFDDARPLEISDDQLLLLMRQRRSTRRYKQKPVPREALDRVAEAAATSPTGTGSASNGVLIIDRREVIEAMMEHTYAFYRRLEGALSHAIPRFFIKRKAGARKLKTLDDFVMPGMRWYLRWREEGAGDEISRDCPALMLFYGPVDEPMVEENCALAALHGILMAETLGVGTCFNHLIPPACNRVPELREMLALPEGMEVYVSVTMGYPAIKFLRAVPRRAAEVRYI